jgi:hypothetical protein
VTKYFFVTAASWCVFLFATITEAATVTLVEPDCASQIVTETLSRIHGELLAVGLEVTQVASPKSRDVTRSSLREWVENRAIEYKLDAIIDLVCDSEPTAVDVWTIERSRNRIELSRVIGEPNARGAPERLAIRTIELLRSSFLANGMFGAVRVPYAEAAQAAPKMRSVEPRQSEYFTPTVGMEIGATVLTGTDGIGPAVMPLLATEWMPRTWLSFRSEVAGFGHEPTLSSDVGRARVAQHYFIFGSGFRIRSSALVSPFLTFSLGTLRTSVRGEAELPRQEHTLSQWSLLFVGSVGTRVRLSRRFYVNLATQVQFAEPYVAVRVVDSTLATSGRPNVAFATTFGVWL